MLRALLGAVAPMRENVCDGPHDFLEQHVEPSVLDALNPKD